MHDDRLRLIFTCCHPALGPDAQVALTLRLLGGLQTAGDRPRVPGARADDGPAAGAGEGQDPRRQDPVPGSGRRRPARPAARRCSPSSTSIFNEGYAATAGDDLVRDDLCAEAIRLGRLLVELMPDEPEALGPARADAADRVAPTGAGRRRRTLVLLPTRTARCGTAR